MELKQASAPYTRRDALIGVASAIGLAAVWVGVLVAGTWAVRACLFVIHWAWTVGR